MWATRFVPGRPGFPSETFDEPHPDPFLPTDSLTPVGVLPSLDLFIVINQQTETWDSHWNPVQTTVLTKLVWRMAF